jgi:hypothetical protein
MMEFRGRSSKVKGMRYAVEGLRLEVEKQGDNGMREIKAIRKISVSL